MNSIGPTSNAEALREDDPQKSPPSASFSAEAEQTFSQFMQSRKKLPEIVANLSEDELTSFKLLTYQGKLKEWSNEQQLDVAVVQKGCGALVEVLKTQ